MTIKQERGSKMCVICKGKIRQDKTDYIENSENHVILIKDVPCEKCGQCGETYFDNNIVQTIEHILSRIQRISSAITLTVIDYTKGVA